MAITQPKSLDSWLRIILRLVTVPLVGGAIGTLPQVEALSTGPVLASQFRSGDPVAPVSNGKGASPLGPQWHRAEQPPDGGRSLEISQFHFNDSSDVRLRNLLPFSVIVLGTALGGSLLTTHLLMRRFKQFNQVSQALAAGQFDQRVPTDSPMAELNKLARTFNHMADQLQQSFQRISTALEESEGKFTTVFRNSPDPMAIATLEDGRLLEVNDSLIAFFGYSRAEMIGRTALELNFWSDLAQRSHYRTALAQHGGIRNQEVQLRTKSGALKTVLLSAEVRLLDGQACVIVVHRDISDRKQLEQSLRSQAEAERLLASISQHIRQSLNLEQILATTVTEVQQTLQADRALIFRLHTDGSGQVIQTAGLPADPVTEQIRWEDEYFLPECYASYAQGTPRIVPDVATDAWAGCLTNFMQTSGVKSKIVAPIVQGQGNATSHVWGLLIVHACTHHRQWQASEADFLQQICNQLAIAIAQAHLYQQLQAELTERQQAEEALRQSEERFRRAFDDAPIGISLVSTTGQFLTANTYYCNLLGYTEAELATIRFQELTYPADLAADLEGFRQMVAGEIRSFQMEKRYITKHGSIIPVLMNAALVRDTNGHPLYCIGHIQDIRDRLKVDRMKDEFVSIVSHELRTPLASIRGALGILEAGVYNNRPEKANHMLHIALNNSDRLVRLVNDILDLERLESGKVKLVMRPCKVAELMQHAIDSVQAIADQATITLIQTPLSASLWAAPDAIIQTLTNLLSNAIKFSASGNTVWLKAAWGGEKLEPAHTHQENPAASFLLFSVSDQGRGIPRDKLEAIFEKFQQIDVSDSRKKGGTGLGLAICKKIVQQHGGSIWADSILGQGSTFYFTLPIRKPQEHDKANFDCG